MNRVQGDYFETLLYKIFVSIDEQTNVAEVAHRPLRSRCCALVMLLLFERMFHSSSLLFPPQLANVLEIDLDLVKVGVTSQPSQTSCGKTFGFDISSWSLNTERFQRYRRTPFWNI